MKGCPLGWPFFCESIVDKVKFPLDEFTTLGKEQLRGSE